MNLLYCLDSNYNIQGLNSINSILDKVNKKLNFYIIHNSPYKFEQMVKELSSYKIDINAIAPGPVNTGMLEEVLKEIVRLSDSTELASYSYFTLMTFMLVFPSGVFTCIVSFCLWPNSELARGDVQEILFKAGSASSTPTIEYCTLLVS